MARAEQFDHDHSLCFAVATFNRTALLTREDRWPTCLVALYTSGIDTLHSRQQETRNRDRTPGNLNS
jgi:hypothetical protein